MSQPQMTYALVPQWIATSYGKGYGNDGKGYGKGKSKFGSAGNLYGTVGQPMMALANHSFNRLSPVSNKQEKKAMSTEGPPPLTRVQVQTIHQLIRDNGGSMKGGLLSTKVEGVKKAQLQPHFLIEQPPTGGGDYVVTIKGPLKGLANSNTFSKGSGKQIQRTPMKQIQSPPMGLANSNKKQKKKSDGAAPASLSDSQVQAIYDIIQENGGSIRGGHLTTIVEGLKKVQIESHFTVEQISSGDFMVSC